MTVEIATAACVAALGSGPSRTVARIIDTSSRERVAPTRSLFSERLLLRSAGRAWPSDERFPSWHAAANRRRPLCWPRGCPGGRGNRRSTHELQVTQTRIVGELPGTWLNPDVLRDAH